jgi:hypothetical protein
LLRRRSNTFHAHRGLFGCPLRFLDPRVGLAGNRRQARGGGPHLAGSVAQFLQGLANHALEFTDVRFDRLLTRRGAGVALTLLPFNPEFVLGLLLEGFERAGKRADLVAAFAISGVDGEIA